MTNRNQTITIDSVTIVPGTMTVNLGYSNGSGNATEIDGQGEAVITYSLSGDVTNNGWSIVGFQAVDALPSDMTVSVNSGTLAIDDKASNPGTEQFQFLIQLSNNGMTYTSADPVVTNEPD